MKLLFKIRTMVLTRIMITGMLYSLTFALSAQNVFTVTKTTDPNPFLFNNNDAVCDTAMLGTFQWALRKANAATDSSIINFNVPGSGAHVFNFNYQVPVITRKVNINGNSQPAGEIILQFPRNININWLIWLNQTGANGSIIQGLHLSGLNDISWGTVGIQLANASYSTVRNNVFTNVMKDIGCYANYSNIYDNLIGVDKNGTNYPIFSGTVEAIQLAYGANYNLIKENTITNKAVGVYINEGSYNLISKNKIYNNSQGCIKGISSTSQNNFKTKPVINAITNLANVTGTSIPGDKIELFGSTGTENANEYLKTVVADNNGNWSADLTGLAWQKITATATDINNNTSQLSVPNSACPALSTTVPCAPINFAIPSGDLPSGAPVTFQNTSVSCISNYPVYWNFGDGTPVYGGGNVYSNVNPTHTYSNQGVYNVTLYALNSNGCMVQSVTKPITIIYGAPPKLKFCHPNIACTNKDIVFENQSTGYFGNPTFTWNYGDGTPTTTSTMHTYSSAGTYTVTLTSPDKTISSTIFISDDCLNPCLAPSLVKIDPTSSTICLGNSEILTASGASTYLWSTGETTNSITVTPLADTTYYVIGTNVITGCSDTTFETIHINAPLFANAGNDTSINSIGSVIIGGDTVTSGGTPPYLYAWSPATSLNDSTLANPTASPTVVTDYKLEVTDALGCKSKDTATVIVYMNIIVNAGSDKTICNGTSTSIGGSPTVIGGSGDYTYSWVPSGLIDSAVANPYTTVTSTTTFTLTATDSKGAIGSGTVTVNILSLPVVNAGNQQTVCSGTIVNLGGSPIVSGGDAPYTYLWSATDGIVSDNTIANPTAQPTISTLYTLTVADSNNCEGTSGVGIFVKPEIELFAGNDNIVLYGDTVVLGGSPTVLNGTPPYNYSWNPSATLDSTNVANPKASPNATISYVLTVTDAGNCGSTNMDTVIVAVDSALVVNAGSNITMCSNDTAIVGGSPTVKGGIPPYTYNWTPSIGLNSSTVSNPKVTSSSNTIYSIIVTDNNGHVGYDTVFVTVNELPVVNAGNDTSMNTEYVVLGGNPTALGGTPPYNYGWYPGSVEMANMANPFFKLTDTTTFYLVVSDSNSCHAKDSITVNFDNIYCSSCNLDSCTWTVSSNTSSNYTINAGQKLCIRSNGIVTGNITINTGGTICNSGMVSPYTFDFNGGKLINNTTGTFTITGNSNINSNIFLINDGAINITGNLSAGVGSFVSNGGIMEVGGKLEVYTENFDNSGVLNLQAGNFIISNNAIVNNDGTLKGIDSLKNSAVLNMGVRAYVFASNMINYSTGIIKRSYVDSIYVLSDTISILIPDSVAKGSIMICSSTENYGAINENIDICDKTPFLNGIVYLDVNMGTVDTTVSFCKGSLVVIDSAEVCGSCPTINIESNSCSGDFIYCKAVSSKIFDNYQFIINGNIVQNGPYSIYSLPVLAVTGDTVIIIGTSNNSPCKTVTSNPYVVKQKSTVNISGDSVSTSESLTLNASGASTYRWTNNNEDTLLGASSSVVVYPLRTTTYLLESIDSNGCIVNSSFEVVKHLQVNYSKNNPTNTEPYSGEINLIITGGKLPFKYLWNTGESMPYINDISKGSYNVTVIDANGEIVNQTITLD